MSTPDIVQTESLGDGIVVIRLNDPDRRNAMSLSLRMALLAVLRDAATDNAVQAVILTGAGGAFCAGGDISQMGQDPDVSLERLRILHDIVRELATFPKPVVAAVNGAAFGAGFSLALLCDVIVTVPGAKFGATFGRMGLVPDTGFLWAIQRRVPRARSLQMVLRAEVLDAASALSMGVVDEVAGNLMQAALTQAHVLVSVAPLAAAAAKHSLAAMDGTLETLLAREYADQDRMYRTVDHREAVTAFREKRSPCFIGA